MKRSTIMAAAGAAAMIVTAGAAFTARTRVECTRPPGTERLVIIRVDGTSFADWEQVPELDGFLRASAGAVVFAPREVLFSPVLDQPEQVEGPVGHPWRDPQLEARRAHAQTLATLGHVEEPGYGGQFNSWPPLTAVRSSPDFVPLSSDYDLIDLLADDLARPTEARLNVERARDTLTEFHDRQVEIDVGDTWRIANALRTAPARDAWIRDALTNAAAPLIDTALEQERPVALVSLLGSVGEQRSGRTAGAVAVVADGVPAGLLSTPWGGFSLGVPALDASPPPGLLTLAQLRSGFHEVFCVAARAPGSIAPAELEGDLRTADRAHVPTAIAFLLLALAISVTDGVLIARRARARRMRGVLAGLGCGLFLLPLGWMAEGSGGGSVAVRATALIATLTLGVLAAGVLRTRDALGVSATIGWAALVIASVQRGGPTAAGSLAAPITDGLRFEGLDAGAIGFLFACMAIAVTWFLDLSSQSRWTRGILAVVALAATEAFVITRVSTGGYAALADRFTTQPTLWPFLILPAILAWRFNARLTRQHEDLAARGAFGAPMMRRATPAMFAVALIVLMVPQGTYAMAILAVLAYVTRMTLLVRADLS